MGEKTLRELVSEAQANERAFQARVRTVLRGSYSGHYRRMLPPLLAALSFRCNNTAYRPVMQALELLDSYAGVDGKVRFYAETDTVPIDGVVPRAWRDAVVDDKGRVERIPYELCVLVDGSAGGVKIITRRGEPWITVPKLEPLAEPQGLRAIKDEVVRRWDTLDLLDVLKDSDFLAEFTSEFTSIASREVIDRDTRRRRLLLWALRRAIAKLVNATFAARDPHWWGGTACASDSKKFGSWESNLMTEWHQRYGGARVRARKAWRVHDRYMSEAAVDLAAVLASFEEPWAPCTVATVNDYDVRVVKMRGEFTPHAHPETDEFFLVMRGSLTIKMNAEEVQLGPGQVYVVPRGVRHQPVYSDGAEVLLLEPGATVNTGDTPSDLTAERRVS